LAARLPHDDAIDPRALTAALRAAAVNAGVEMRREDVRSLDLPAEQVVVAAGCWSAELAPVPVRPVKGQILRLRDPSGPGLVGHVIRMASGYLVPRGDGRYVLGATVEERGFDPHVTAGATHDMLRDAIELVPGVAELAIEETSVAYRPGTPDNAPILGPGARPGLHWATGHYRHGVLLAPITAEIVVGALAGEPVAPEFSAARFSEVPAR
jgi:glycine oxidase